MEHGILDTWTLSYAKGKSRQLIGYAGITAHDAEDIEQEILLHLIEQMHRHDPNVADKHKYVRNLVKNRVKELLRDRFSHQRRAETADVSINVPCRDADGGMATRGDMLADPEPSRLERAAERLEVNEVLTKMPEDLQRICHLLRSNTIYGVAKILKTDRKSLHRSLDRIREYFLRYGFEDFPQTRATV